MQTTFFRNYNKFAQIYLCRFHRLKPYKRQYLSLKSTPYDNFNIKKTIMQELIPYIP